VPTVGTIAERFFRKLLLERHTVAFAMVVFGFGLSAASFLAVRSNDSQVARLKFEREAQSGAAAISLAIERSVDIADSSGALFDSPHRVTRAQFRAFGRRALHKDLSQHSELEAIGWIPYVPGRERGAYERAAQADLPGFAFREFNAKGGFVTAARRDEYFPVYYAEGRGRNPYGLDQASIPSRRDALLRARDTGKVVASGMTPVLAGNFKGQNGVLLFRPVYRYGTRVETAEERRRSLVGFTFCVFVVGELIDGVLQRMGSTGVRVAIYDDSALAAEPFLAVWPDRAQEAPPAAVPPQAAPGLESTARFEVGGRRWRAVFTPRIRPFGDATPWQSWAVPGVGVLFSLLLAVYFETARRQALRMREQAITDPLTGLYNRRYLWDFLERECLRARRSGAKIAAIMIDVDRFKRVNDTHGHEAGDRILTEIAALLRRSVRRADLACRYGGEEFVLILPEASIELVRQRAEEIRAAVKQLPILFRGKSLGPVTVSLGIAVFPEDAEDAESLVRSADEAMYRAKREGRDRVVVTLAGPSDIEPAPPAASGRGRRL
jgi:diguanylate cyclase (GGDEF)-like protein